jgi:23S rRNA pseudouridine1911/1915/1917 synthase
MPNPEIIHEDKDFLVVNKPAGLQVHAARIAGGAMTEGPTLVGWLLKRYPELRTVGDDPEQRPGIVHRLDKGTSGVMVVARNQPAFEYLKGLFQKHEVKKTYLAVVAGELKEKKGTIDAPIGIRNGTMKRSTRSAKMAKPAVTEYKVLKTFAREGFRAQGDKQKFSLVELYPKTGRTHQIRVHLASIGHPVVGDRLYGPKAQPAWADRMMLHALSIEFTAPDGHRAKFEAASRLSTDDFP